MAASIVPQELRHLMGAPKYGWVASYDPEADTYGELFFIGGLKGVELSEDRVSGENTGEGGEIQDVFSILRGASVTINYNRLQHNITETVADIAVVIYHAGEKYEVRELGLIYGLGSAYFGSFFWIPASSGVGGYMLEISKMRVTEGQAFTFTTEDGYMAPSITARVLRKPGKTTVAAFYRHGVDPDFSRLAFPYPAEDVDFANLS